MNQVIPEAAVEAIRRTSVNAESRLHLFDKGRNL